MIGLIFFASVAIWFHIALLLGLALPHWFGLKGPLRWILSLLLTPVLFVLPVADELIGRHQFAKLCEHETVTLSPNWRDVKKVERVDTSGKLSNFPVRITYTEINYKNMETGEIFLSYKRFYNYGGLLLDKIGLRLSASPPDCRPPNYYIVMQNEELKKLLESRWKK